METQSTTPAPKRRGAKGLAAELGLPPYMEARPMKHGGYSYRVLNPEKKWVSVGWNLDEALAAHQRILGTSWNTSAQDAREVFLRAKKGAARRGIEFHITEDDIRQMFEQQNSRCALTQKPFNNTKPHGQRNRPWCASLDRRDSRKHYTVDNCRLVCTFVNVALNTYGDGLFTELLEHMVRRIVKEELRKNESLFPRPVSRNSHAKSKKPGEPG